MEISKKFVDLHIQYSDKIIEAMKNSVKYGTPVNAPIWWLDPTDPETYLIDSGEKILKTYVTVNNTIHRSIFVLLHVYTNVRTIYLWIFYRVFIR